MRKTPFIIGALVAALACPLAGCSGEPELVLGTGYDAFAELAPGGNAPILSGPQGGYHVLLALRCDGCSAAVEVAYGIEDAATGEALTFDDLRREVELSRVDGWGQYMPLIAFLRSTDVTEYTDRAVVVWLEIVSEGAVATTPAVLRYDGALP